MTPGCISPPGLGDTQLLLYLDGAAAQETAVHLERCGFCSGRASALRQLQGGLQRELFRVACPPPLELGEYQLGLLPHDRVAVLSRHLDECPHCPPELAQLKRYMLDLAPTLELSVVEKVRVLVARLVGGQGGAFSPFAPVAAGIRGGDAGPLIYEAGDVQIVLDLQDDAAGPDQKTLLGLLTGMAPDSVQAHLYREGQLVTTTAIDELGNFVLPDLPVASYELILSGPELEVHIQTLDIQG